MAEPTQPDTRLRRLQRRLVPGLKYSQYHYYDALHELVPPGCEWLDIGCGHQMFAAWMREEEREIARRSRRLVGADLDFEGMRRHATIRQCVMASVERLPFPADSFDLVTANMVVEHLPDPAAALREIGRVLRPGGRFVFHTPNAANPLVRFSRLVPDRLKKRLIGWLECRREEDVFPTLYRMNTEGAVRAHAAAAGLSVEDLRFPLNAPRSWRLGPLAVTLELLVIRALSGPRWRPYREVLIAVMRKPAERALTSAAAPRLVVLAGGRRSGR